MARKTATHKIEAIDSAGPVLERTAGAVALVPLAVTNEQLALIKRTVAVGATDDELALFLYDCKRRGVHPLDKLFYFSKIDGKYTPLTSIDYLRARAAQTGEMAGSDEPEIEYDENGQIISASIAVYRMVAGQRCAFRAKARWSEYVPKGGKRLLVWKAMSHIMIGKCVEALALRKAFPAELGQLYVEEELDRAAPVPAPKAGAAPTPTDDEGGAPPSPTKNDSKTPLERARAAWFAALSKRMADGGVLWRGKRHTSLTDPQMRAYVSDCIKRDIKSRTDLTEEDWKIARRYVDGDTDPGNAA